MNMTVISTMLLTMTLAVSSANANGTEVSDAGDAIAGKKVAKKCVACHTFDEGGKNKVGPNLFGIVDREIASVEGFKYSKAFAAKKEEKFVWDNANMDGFLAKPKKFIKKTKMSFAGVKKEKDRKNLIAYLATLKK